MMKNSSGKLVGLCLLISILFLGCTTVQLVSNYDESTDKQAQELQKKLDTHFIKMKNLRDEPTTYKENQKFYEEVLADIDSLENRAAIIYKNEETQLLVKELKINFALLIYMHKHCISKPPLTEEQLKLLKEKSVDLSMDCKKEYGFNPELKNRGNQSYSNEAIEPTKSSFDSILNSIASLELDKKRAKKNEKTTTKE